MKLIERDASRLLVLSPRGRALLLRLEPSFRDPFWVTPGGGLDDGESFEAAAMRELREEVGRDDLQLGPWVWSQRVEFAWEDWLVRQHQRTYLVEVLDEFDPVIMHPDEEPIVGGSWFHPNELELLGEDVYPDDLARLLRELLSCGPPTRPILLPDRG